MYEIDVEMALVKWLPSFYSEPFKLISIDRQVQMPNGGRADVVSVAAREGEHEQVAHIDVWEVKRGAIDLDAIAQVAAYGTSLYDFYFGYFLSTDIRPAHELVVQRHLVGASVARHPLLQLIQEFARIWIYTETPGGLKFNSYSNDRPGEISSPFILKRIFGSLAWKPAPWVKPEGGNE